MIEREDFETREDIDDVVAEFAALQQNPLVPIEIQVVADADVINLRKVPGRIVFLEKDSRSY